MMTPRPPRNEFKQVILIISMGLVCGWLLCGCSSQPPAVDLPDRASANPPQLVLKTDKPGYQVGETIIITVENNLDSPIRYDDGCALRLCQNVSDDWVCAMTECHGPAMVVEPGRTTEIRAEAQDLGQATLKYQFEYQLVSEETFHTADSNEFRIE